MMEEKYDYKQVHADFKPIIGKGRENWFYPEYRKAISDEEIIGTAISKNFQWRVKPIVSTFLYALEDSNAHELAEKIEDLMKGKTVKLKEVI